MNEATRGPDMPEVSFYHLESQPVTAALPRLLEKVVAAGHKVLVHAPGAERLGQLDEALWTYDPASFLPHGLCGQDHAQLQPILLSEGVDAPNNADILVVVDGHLPDDISAFARCLYMFEGASSAVVATARQHWSRLKEAGHGLAYWQQGGRGGWEKKA